MLRVVIGMPFLAELFSTGPEIGFAGALLEQVRMSSEALEVGLQVGRKRESETRLLIVLDS